MNVQEILPGTRVKVFDPFVYCDDKTTPPSETFLPGTVIRRYGYRSTYNTNWIYPDCIDVRFDHRPKQISHGHFTKGIRILPPIINKVKSHDKTI